MAHVLYTLRLLVLSKVIVFFFFFRETASVQGRAFVVQMDRAGGWVSYEVSASLRRQGA